MLLTTRSHNMMNIFGKLHKNNPMHIGVCSGNGQILRLTLNFDLDL